MAAVALIWYSAAHPPYADVYAGSRYGFTNPRSIAIDGGHVWVVNGGNGKDGSVTELDASDGRWVRTLSGRSYGFDGPSGIVIDGGHVWVSNYFRYGGRGGTAR